MTTVLCDRRLVTLKGGQKEPALFPSPPPTLFPRFLQMQVCLNYKRRSTDGWNIDNVMLDFTGGVLSLAQLLLDAGCARDWTKVCPYAPGSRGEDVGMVGGWGGRRGWAAFYPSPRCSGLK